MTPEILCEINIRAKSLHKTSLCRIFSKEFISTLNNYEPKNLSLKEEMKIEEEIIDLAKNDYNIIFNNYFLYSFVLKVATIIPQTLDSHKCNFPKCEKLCQNYYFCKKALHKEYGLINKLPISVPQSQSQEIPQCQIQKQPKEKCQKHEIEFHEKCSYEATFCDNFGIHPDMTIPELKYCEKHVHPSKDDIHYDEIIDIDKEIEANDVNATVQIIKRYKLSCEIGVGIPKSYFDIIRNFHKNVL